MIEQELLKLISELRTSSSLWVWQQIRQALLMIVDAIERDPLCYDVTTAQIRKTYKEQTRKEL